MTRADELRAHLDVPYIIIMESIEKEDGDWVRRATYPELPDCVVEAATPIEAVERLEELRVRSIRELLEEGRPVPTPRDPLRWVRSTRPRPDPGRDEEAPHAR